MAFKAFYDGSGKSDRPSVTLTGVAASEELWAQFEPLWLNRLDRNKVIDRDFHMADLMSRNGNFKGWTISQRDALLIDLFSVFGEFWTKKMSAYSCTVFFAAHLEAKKNDCITTEARGDLCRLLRWRLEADGRSTCVRATANSSVLR